MIFIVYVYMWDFSNDVKRKNEPVFACRSSRECCTILRRRSTEQFALSKINLSSQWFSTISSINMSNAEDCLPVDVEVGDKLR